MRQEIFRTRHKGGASMALRDIRLWLHDGTPAGARTVFEGDAFVSILGADDAAREALALLGGREAVTVFAGPDAMPGLSLIHI